MLLRNTHLHTFDSDCRAFNDYQTFNTTYTTYIYIYILVYTSIYNWNTLITINNREKISNNLTFHLNFRDCIQYSTYIDSCKHALLSKYKQILLSFRNWKFHIVFFRPVISNYCRLFSQLQKLLK